MKKNNSNKIRFNNHGFIQIHTLFTISLAFILFITAAFGFYLTQNNSIYRKECITRTTNQQAFVLKSVRALFYLNPVSSGIRFAKIFLTAAIFTAGVFFQVGLVIQLTKIYNQLVKIQKSLDKIQKFIIQSIKIKLKFNYYSDLMALVKLSYHFTTNKGFQTMFIGLFFVKPGQTPQLKIHPDSESEYFPNYEWDNDASEKLKIEYKWHIWFYAVDSFQKYFNWHGRFNNFCSVQPNLESDNEWKLIIETDKPSSNSQRR